VKLFWRLLLLLILAVGGALAWHALADDPGYVLITLRGYSVESTLVVAIVAVLLAWIVLRLAVWLLRLPFRAWRRHARRIARDRLAGGLLALHEGRWARAEKLLTRAASDPALRRPALIAALRAAQSRGDFDRVAALRTQLADAGDQASLALIDGESLLSQGRAGDALDALARGAEQAPLAPRALQLQMRALAAAGRAHEGVAQLPALRQTQLLEGEALDAFEAELIAQSLRQARHADELAQRWESSTRAQRSDSRIVAAYAERASALGFEDQAAAAIEHALKKRWSDDLARLYGHVPRGQRGSPLKAAEHWLKTQPNSPALLLALGRLCREEALWGKAEDYLHRALAQGAGAEAWEELGHAYAAQRDDARARVAYGNALRVARTEAAVAMPGRGLRELIQDEAVAEERTPMGVPRLPGVG
jgi:HemY protein